MKGLLIKDLLNLRQTGRVWALLLIVFLVIGFVQQSPAYVGSMLMVMLLLLPVNAMAYDENARWDAYALTMPITRRDLALSKYLLTLLGAVDAALVSVACGLLMGAGLREVLATVGLLLAVGLCMVSVLLPLLFRFGVQKGRMLMIVIVLLPLALAAAFPDAVAGAVPVSTGWLPLAALPLFALSAALSVRICGQKEY